MGTRRTDCPHCGVGLGLIHLATCPVMTKTTRPVVSTGGDPFGDTGTEDLRRGATATRFLDTSIVAAHLAGAELLKRYTATQGTAATRYPDDNPKTIHGFAKPSISLVPPVAIVEMARAFRHGADKYGPANWRDKPVTIQTYIDAALRHLLAIADGEDVDPESGCFHAAHVASCMAIIMDAKASGTLQDRRPTPGQAAELIRQYTAATAPPTPAV